MTRSLLSALILLFVLAGLSTADAQPAPNPDMLTKKVRDPACQTRVDAALTNDDRYEQIVDAAILTLQPGIREAIHEKQMEDIGKALMDYFDLCASCKLERKALAEAREKRSKELEGELCKDLMVGREVYVFYAKVEGRPQLFHGPVVLTKGEAQMETTRLNGDLALRFGPEVTASTSKTYGSFSCGYVYRIGEKLFFGTAQPGSVAKDMQGKQSIGATIESPGVCRDGGGS